MLSAIFVGIALLLATTVIQAIVGSTTVQLAASLKRSGFAGASYWNNVAVMMAIVLIALTGIILQIAAWASVLFGLDKFDTFGGAFYYSASNFTTLGLDAIQFQDHWRLLAPLESVNGVLMFGVTTAIIINTMNSLSRRNHD